MDQSGLTLPTPKESLLLIGKIQSGYRLACSARFLHDTGSVTVIIPSESLVRKRQFVETGSERKTSLDAAVSKFMVEVTHPSINERMTDSERLLTDIKNSRGLMKVKLDYNVIADLPETLRRSNKVTPVLWDNKRVISVETGDTQSTLYGIAIDVGTSRITCSLLNLNNGERIAQKSVENPQIAYGEDILTRITYSNAGGDNTKQLQRTIIAGINELTENVCVEANVDPYNVYEAVLVGNTVMHHLTLGINTKYLARTPFSPAINESMSIRGAEIGLKINPNSIAHFLPIIDAFVGADAVGDILYTNLNRRGVPTLLLDIGTNTEVILRDREGLTCCSCASGPAFEGVHIEHGMKAVEGALESIKIRRSSFKVSYKVLGTTKPIGLCGSAIIDVVAELFKVGLIDRFGKFSKNADTLKIKKISGVKKFVIVDAEESGTGNDITISERDINEVILAKAAIYTGCSILMRSRGLTRRELRRILIAGGFGKNLDRQSVKLIGLIPDVPSSKIKFIGNAAHVGAEIVLRSRKAMCLAEKIAREAKYIELAARKEFSGEYAAALMLPHKNVELFTSPKDYKSR